MNKQSLKQIISKEVKEFFKLKTTERLWHIPLLAALCIGIPLLSGMYFNNMKAASIASVGGLVILYLPVSTLADRMITLLICSFGFMVSFAMGLCFSFNPLLSAIAFGLYAIAVHWVVLYFRLKPPRNFFFIMLASMASCMPFDLQTIPYKLDLIGIGTMIACLLALLYSLIMLHKHPQHAATALSMTTAKKRYANLVEACIIGFFMFASLLISHLLQLKNPYWVPISCLAVMQGATLHNIRERMLHRILGTFIGLGSAWLILSINKTTTSICISIILLQFIVEMLVVRHYALAVIFITPLTLLLAEAANPALKDPDALIAVRFWNIALGSVIGVVGGWFVHNEKLRYRAVRSFRKTRVFMRRH